jgi:glycosidase
MKNLLLLSFLTILAISAIIFVSCKSRKQAELPKPTEVKNLDWVKNAVIYEANIRQFSKEGTFKAFAKDLPRLKELGIEIIWVMPINPIGEKNRKGPLGSYYSVKDYKAINPEYGNLDDFKSLVEETHKLGMKLIIDWVPNHSSWDNPLIKEHPEYYLKDSTGKMVSPFDWTDVVRFDYNNPEMRKWMIETLKYWLTETGIDGFRCDVAHMIPVSFWDSCRMELDKVKPIFFLAEADQPELHAKAYDASYDWKFHHIMNQIAKGKKSANDIEKHFNWVDSIYPQGSILMEFTSNHDENSWNGTEFERLGNDGAQAFAILTATVPGMMLIYNGQEAAFNRRLKFFEKDSITWGDYRYTDFYKQLISIKKENTALWNGLAGGIFKRIHLTDKKNVFAFIREKDNNKVVVFINLSKKHRKFILRTDIANGKYRDAFSGGEIELRKYDKMQMAPWEYKVLKAE